MKDDKGLRQSYFGTGETFLFKLGDKDGEGSVKYPWVNFNKAGGDEDGSGLTKAEQHARELFMSGQHDMISIGGG